jgi:class 3 adenylate cyclase/tetratricopeptide (TPR) repeat protein
MAGGTCPSCGRENPEGFVFCGFCGAALETAAQPGREVRKTVTIVFSDVTGSTAMGEHLDPESLRRVMSRYFDAMRTVIERHGGTVEKFIGDAVMAVFGIPVLHEDDALRAVRAAAEMRQALAALNEDLQAERGVSIAIRTGVNTGEVVAGDPAAGQTLVTGDAVNTAARLEQAAAPGEILLGDPTYGLVRDAVRVEPVDPLELKGKADPVPAHRLLGVLAEADAGHKRRLDSPIVGRERELGLLQQAFERTTTERDPYLFTLLGTAGVGKSRLVQEFLGRVGDQAAVLRGRCLPYGDGITYYPVFEVLYRMVGGEGSLTDRVAAVIADGDRAEEIADRLGAILGEDDAGAVGHDEVAWAVRTLLEGMGRRGPVVVVFDDIHWGEATFLDLVDHVAEWSRDSSLLVLCVARPELLELRPGWGGGKLNASTILLEPLTAGESAALMSNLLGSADLPAVVADRITAAAEGNPLFVEEMLGMLMDGGHLRLDGDGWTPVGDLSAVAVPPTIQALLAARLDGLELAQRGVLERASIVGQEFWRGAVVELSPEPDQPAVPSNLMTLVRKELIRPGRAQFAGDDGFRFRHLLIRDAAYESMPKGMRAELHERFSAWLERVAGEGVAEFEAILGYHLEQAARYRRELGPEDPTTTALGQRASTWLAAAGRRAFIRSDYPAAVSLYRRALDLRAEDDPARVSLYPDLCQSRWYLGQFEISAEETRAGIAEAVAMGDLRAVRVLEIVDAMSRAQSDPSFTHAALEEAILVAVADLEERGDDASLAFAWGRLALVRFWRGQAGEALAAVDRGLEHARRSGDAFLELEVQRYAFGVYTWGPMPVDEALARFDAIRPRFAGDHVEGSGIDASSAYLLAIAGRTEEARERWKSAEAESAELGDSPLLASMRCQIGVLVQRALGNRDEAERLGRDGVAALERMGETGYRSTGAAYLADMLAAQGRTEDAAEMVRIGEENASADDFSSQTLLAQARSRILAARGRIEEALAQAREAVAIVERSDYIAEQAEARMALAEVLAAAGRPAEAAAEIEQAIDRYRHKGANLYVDQASAELERLGASGARSPD